MDKPPGVAETIEWVAALVALGVADLVADDDQKCAVASRGALAKTPYDRDVIAEAFADYTKGACR